MALVNQAIELATSPSDVQLELGFEPDEQPAEHIDREFGNSAPFET